LLKHFFIFPKYHLILRLIRYLIFQQLHLNVMMHFLYSMKFIDFKIFIEIQYFKYLINLMKNFVNFKFIYYLLFVQCCSHLYFQFINCYIIKWENFSHFDHYYIGNWIEYLMKQFQGNYNQWLQNFDLHSLLKIKIYFNFHPNYFFLS
jgi:hypothetical protein